MATRFHPSSPAVYGSAPGSANFESPRKRLTQERTQSRGLDAPKRSAGIDVSDLLHDMSDSNQRSGPPSAAGKPRGVSPTDYYNYHIERAKLFERVQQLEVQLHSLNAAYKESTMRRAHEENSFREISCQERNKADKTISKLTSKVDSRESLLIELVQAIAMLPSDTISDDVHLQTLCVKTALLIPILRPSLVSIVDLDKLPKSLLSALGGQKPQSSMSKRNKTIKKKAKSTKVKTAKVTTTTEPYDDFDRTQTPLAMETFTGDLFSTMHNHAEEEKDASHHESDESPSETEKMPRQTSLRRGSSTRYLTGQRVKVNYRGRGVFFPATIKARRSSDKTFDVDYDDGEQETFVKEEFILPLITTIISDDMNSFIKSDNNSMNASLNASPDISPKANKILNFSSTNNTVTNLDNQQQASKEDADRLLAELVASIDSNQQHMEEGHKLLSASELLALDESILSTHSEHEQRTSQKGGDHLLSKEIQEFIALAEEERDTDHLLTELIQAEADKLANNNNTGSVKRKRSINKAASISGESEVMMLTREESSLLNPDVEAYIQSLTFLGGGSNDEQLDAQLQDLIDGTSDSVDSDPFALSNDILAATKRRLTQQLAANGSTTPNSTVDVNRPSQSLRQASNILPALEEEEGDVSWEDADDEEENSLNTPNNHAAAGSIGKKKKKKKGSKKKKAKSVSIDPTDAKQSKRMSADGAAVSTGGAKSILSAAAAAVKAVVDGGSSMLSGTSSKSKKGGDGVTATDGDNKSSNNNSNVATSASGKYWWDMSAQQPTQRLDEQDLASRKSTKAAAEDSYVEKLKLGGDLDLDPSLTF